MAPKIQHKRSAVAGKQPQPVDLEYGEIAVNYEAADPALYIRDTADAIRKIGTQPDATETVKGIAEIATTAEANAGTDDQKIVTPLKLKGFQQLFVIQSATRPTLVTHPNIVTGTIWVDQSQSPLVLHVWDPTVNNGLGDWGTAADGTQPDATETIKGIVELATAAETTTGTDSTRAVHPAGLKVELDKKAPLASPALTGVPTAPTAAPGTNTTQIATTAFVAAATPADATTTTKGVVQLADAGAITAGTAGLVVDAAQLKAVSDADDWTRTGTTLAPKAAGDVVEVSAGTAALPGLTPVGDPNTGIYSPGADQVAVSTGGTGRLFVNSAGNVGIGTASPSVLLGCEGSSTGDGVGLHLDNTSGSKTVLVSTGSSYSYSDVGASTAWLTSEGTKVAVGPYTAGAVQFINGGECARIDASGNFLLGGTLPATPNITLKADGEATFATNTVQINALGQIRCTSAQGGLVVQNQSAFSNSIQIIKAAGNAVVTNLKGDGTATFAGNITAGNVSDAKFKENITDAHPQLADVVALGSQLKNWDWKDTAPLNDELRSKRFLGLVAQEAEKVSPGITYEVGEGADSYKVINHDILVMKLLGAVAEQNTRIEALEAQVKTLTSGGSI